MARQVLENGVILPAEYSDDWYDDMTSNLTKLDDVIGSDSEKLSSSDVGAAALSNNYNDLDNLPTIPTVNDATLTIQKNGVDVQTFTANASSNVTANITVPTKTSDLTNDSDFVVSSNLATVATSGDYDDLSNKPSIPTNTSDLNNDSNFVDTSNSAVASGITSAKVTDYDTHIADTDIHVTTADKATWNTVTSKANDSDVVHRSGDETVAGEKTFSNVVPINGVYIGNEPSTTFRTVLLLRSRYDTVGKSGWLVSKFRSNSAQGALSGSDSVFLNFDVLENEVRTNGILRFNLSSWSGNTPGKFSLIPSSSIESYLGASGNKWSAINGLSPSSLGMPDLANGIDISSYITQGTGRNEYTPPANGYVSIILKNNAATAIFLYQGDFGRSSYSSTALPNETDVCCINSIPVVSGTKVNIDIKGVNAYIVSAKFFPCQGNV